MMIGSVRRGTKKCDAQTLTFDSNSGGDILVLGKRSHAAMPLIHHQTLVRNCGQSLAEVGTSDTTPSPVTANDERPSVYMYMFNRCLTRYREPIGRI